MRDTNLPKSERPSRRQFLGSAAASAFGVLSCGSVLGSPFPAGAKDFQGIYPIMQTPYTDGGGLDYEVLANEVAFLDKTGSHGIVWPQLASEYAELTFDERIRGAETVVTAAQGLRPKVVIGVQAQDAETAVKHAKHAEKIQPDAIIALPAREKDQQEFDLKEVSRYYKAISNVCGLPMFVQSMGNMSVEFLVNLARETSTIQFVKDEAGHTLSRVSEFRENETTKLGVFTGAHGITLIDEMRRGSAGSMPAASWADLYVRVWDLWHSGRKEEAYELFSKVLLFITDAFAYGLESLKYVLHLRGVFPNWKVRGPAGAPFDERAQTAVRETFEFVRPLLVV